VAAFGFAGERTGRAGRLFRDIMRADGSSRIKLRTAHANVALVGRADRIAPGYWTGRGVGRFVPGKQNRVEGSALSRRQKWEINALGVNFPHSLLAITEQPNFN
jgi:hypothetical protein